MLETGRIGARPAMARLAVLVVVALVVAGCTGSGSPPTGGTGAAGGINAAGGSGSVAAPPSDARVAFQPADGSADVNPTAAVSATVSDGTFSAVTLAVPGAEPVRGTLSADRRTWTTDEPLGYGRTYRFTGSAADAAGRTAPLSGSFSTVKPRQQVRATINIGNGRTVGIAAPIILQFDEHINDKAAVEKALEVQTSVPTVGSWGWLQDENGGSRAHWRPKDYWKPGTVVHLAAKLYGVAFGDGNFGREDLASRFTIGRAQIVQADTQSHQMVVLRGGKEVARYDASYGLDSDPDRNTRSGIHVVTEKFTDKRMVSQKYGYDTMEKWAVRMSNNGEFIHANPSTKGVQGERNVSHGCVNLSTENAKAYYDSAIYGDPVEVTNSGVALSPREGDIFDWAIPWSQWQSLSART